METKQINIIPPSGMEIIREIKDGIETISFKLIEEKKITYKDVCNKLFVEASKKVYFITEDEISCCLTSYTAIKRSIGNESLTKEEQEATLCEGMLRNVARYLNPEGWKSVPTKVSKRWYFYINTTNKLDSAYNNEWIHSCIYFESEQLLEQAKEILGEEVIRKALIKQY